MWDGREPDLQTQALDATLVHAQPSGSPTDAQLQQIVNLESSLFTAQSVDSLAGDLTAQGANGGPAFLSTQPFSAGMNSGTGFDPNVFTLYTNWANASGSNAAAQQSIARGEMLFNSFPMQNHRRRRDSTTFWARPQVIGTCSTCHNTPNVGEQLDLRDDGHRNRLAQSQPSFVPDSVQRQHAAGDHRSGTRDGDRQMCRHRQVQSPSMRGLAARAPYFHSGTAIPCWMWSTSTTSVSACC